MKRFVLAGAALTAILTLFLLAVVPQKWEVRSKEDFLKGKFDGISLSFDGVLTLAPREEKLAGPAEEFYLSYQLGSEGEAYLGTGHGGKVYRIGKDGKVELYFQAPEMDVTCLALDRKGVLYVGTSPNGKIYKVAGMSKGEEFFNPNEKYVWDLLFTERGTLLAAVGESGGIYEVNAQGEGRLVLKADANHILCMRRSAGGGIIAGSGGGGLVYRMSPEGRASVVFESPYEEMRSLAVDGAGNIYASASGVPSKPKKEEAPSAAARPEAEVTVIAASSGTEASAAMPAASKESGAVYKITPEGVARKLWSSDDEFVYSLVWQEAENRVIFGTGSKGRIYSVGTDDLVSLLLQRSSEQVYLLVPLESRIVVLANNPSSLDQVFPDERQLGEYLSSVLDTRTVSAWGKLEWEAGLPQGTTLQLQSRTGNSLEPSPTWSEWSPPYQKISEQILSPRARFLQFKAIFKSQSGKVSPTLQRLHLYYLQTNIAPVFTRLDFLRPNEVFLKLQDQDDVILGADKNLPETPQDQGGARMGIPARKVERKGFQTVVWEAEDENGDRLVYSIFVRREGEADWRLLQEKWTEAIYAFDTVSLPDGEYALKIAASDSPSNPPGTERRAEKVGAPFTIDNSLPTVKNFTVARNGNALEVSFQTDDVFSAIAEVKCLIRPDEWRVVFPTDGICDSRTESFKFTLKLPAGADNLITVRVRDGLGNIGVYRQTF